MACKKKRGRYAGNTSKQIHIYISEGKYSDNNGRYRVMQTITYRAQEPDTAPNTNTGTKRQNRPDT